MTHESYVIEKFLLFFHMNVFGIKITQEFW